ncbi:hypothetical protein PC128_g14182 [Phytophthora cactorum]|nr:hypothetical protein PC128_g14182 [Phytophthora cactorum]
MDKCSVQEPCEQGGTAMVLMLQVMHREEADREAMDLQLSAALAPAPSGEHCPNGQSVQVRPAGLQPPHQDAGVRLISCCRDGRRENSDRSHLTQHGQLHEHRFLAPRPQSDGAEVRANADDGGSVCCWRYRYEQHSASRMPNTLASNPVLSKT